MDPTCCPMAKSKKVLRLEQNYIFQHSHEKIWWNEHSQRVVTYLHPNVWKHFIPPSAQTADLLAVKTAQKNAEIVPTQSRFSIPSSGATVVDIS